MIYHMYAVRDALTGYMTPTVDVNDQTALRNFSHALRRSQDIMNSNPQDFSLWRIASYDTDTGAIVPEQPLQLLVDGASVIGGDR